LVPLDPLDDAPEDEQSWLCDPAPDDDDAPDDDAPEELDV
jgi:hypothetical protein